MVDESASWELDPHTLRKHDILKGYLEAWVPIMSGFGGTQSSLERLLIVDGFAGPGTYEDGHPGSPQLIFQTVEDHPQELPLPVSLLFIENDPDIYAELEDNTAELRTDAEESDRFEMITVEQGECEQVLSEGIRRYDEKDKRLGPAFFFLDQFGYSQVSLSLVKEIMRHRFCEAFIFLNWRDMNRWMKDKTKWAGITDTFGTEEWKKAFDLAAGERATYLLECYTRALHDGAEADYVWHFAMHDKNGKLIYWLFFCTSSLDGLKQMKRAMLRVDETGRFRFSDRDDPRQGYLFQKSSDEIVAEKLYEIAAGKTLTVKEAREIVLTETSGVLHKGALKVLEKQGKLKPVDTPDSRRKGTFPDEDLKLEFK